MSTPSSKPSILPLLLVLSTTATGLYYQPVIRDAFAESRPIAAAADKPSKKEPVPKGKCGSGCAGTPPDCKCPAQTERRQQTRLTEVPHSMLGEGQPWFLEPVQSGPAL